MSESDGAVDGGVVRRLAARTRLELDTQVVVSHPGDREASQVSFLLGGLFLPRWSRLVVRPVSYTHLTLPTKA